MSNQSQYITALQAEHIKKKGTGIYLISAIVGAVFPILVFLVRTVSTPGQGDIFPYSHYFRFLADSAQPLTNFFLPLLIIIVTSRITQLDHRNGGWQLMETQPVKKWALYFSKFTVVLISILITLISLLIVGLVCGWLWSVSRTLPETAMLNLPVADILQLFSRLFVASILIAALQYLISVLVPGFIWSIIIGFSILLGGIILKSAGYNWEWYPTLLLGRVVDYTSSDLGHWFIYTEYFGLVAAALILFIGFKWYYHKTPKLAFFNRPAQTLSLIAVVAVTGLAMAFILKPKTMKPYHTTVLAGELNTDFDVKNIYIVNPLLEDTLATIPVTNKRFHFQTDSTMLFDQYDLYFGNYFRGGVYLGTNDSLYVKAEANPNGYRLKIYGTALAENRAPSQSRSWSRVAYYVEDNQLLDAPEVFGELLYEEWKDRRKEQDQFKTVDGFVPSDQYNIIQDKLLAVSYLNYWNRYLTKRKAAFPDAETPTIAVIQQIKSRVGFDEENLLGKQAYMEYLNYHLTSENKEDISAEEKLLKGIASLPAGSFRNKVLFYHLKQTLNNASDSKERTALLEKYATNFTSEHYYNKTLFVYNELQRLSKGEPAPAIDAINLDLDRVSLEDLKGKHVIIDVWATWCGPCKMQWPHFERLAIKYKEQAIHFVSLNCDTEQIKWELDAKGKSQTILQWHVPDLQKLIRDYNIPGIPRFILISPDGKFINAQMPMPSNKNFEDILRRELGLPE